MALFRAGELAQWVGSLWQNGVPEGDFSGVSIDTRTMKPGNLYVAIRGEHHDGHQFVEQAFAKGAAGALVDRAFSGCDRSVLCVPDTVKGLQAMAAGYRKKWTAKVVGITGSVGKTSVKEMCAEVLAREAATHRTAGNLNNYIGLPLSMMRMDLRARFGVFEIGMNQPGEIGPLARILLPNVGIITCIGSAHIENFGSVHEIAMEKSKLIANVRSSGMVILDRDSEWFSLLRHQSAARVVTVSLGKTADYAGKVVGDRMLHVCGHRYEMPLPGEHVMRNALRAIALGLEMGLSPDEVAEGISHLKLPPMRWEQTKEGEVTFINDAYNANQLSMRAVLQTYAGLSGDGRKWVVVGGMRELGHEAEREHRALGKFIEQLGFDGVVTVGELARMVKCKGLKHFYQVDTAADAAKLLKEHLQSGDCVLLKASRGERLENVLRYYKET